MDLSGKERKIGCSGKVVFGNFGFLSFKCFLVQNIFITHLSGLKIQMLNLYDQLPFDNPDGGVWAQGFPVEYDKEKVKKEKRLDVIVVPHTHCDPGLFILELAYRECLAPKIPDFLLVTKPCL